MYRAIVVDDQRLFRAMTKALLEKAGDFEVVCEASDGDEVVDAYMEFNPDLVVMDVQMERVNGFEATSRLLASDPNAVVVLTSMSQDPEYGRLALDAGAIAFFSKRSLDAEQVRSALKRHGAGGSEAA